jgi:hypothetical protein
MPAMIGAMEWMVELLLIGLLGATLFHAVRLERALGILRRDRSALVELVASFNASTRQAEAGVERLRSALDGAGRQINRQIEGALALKDDLQLLIERGEQIADRLDRGVRRARASVDEGPAGGRAGRDAVSQREDVLAIEGRSQAERDLLKALRLAR